MSGDTPKEDQRRALEARDNPGSPEAAEWNRDQTRATEAALEALLPKCQPLTKGTKLGLRSATDASG